MDDHQRGRTYLTSFFGLAILLVLALWVHIRMLPQAFLPDEYARWRGKQELISSCTFGDTVVLGDSRAATNLVPARFRPARMSNFALAGSTPVEAYYILKQVLRCRNKPKLVIMSFTPRHLESADTFWRKTVRFGVISLEDTLEVVRRGRELNDQKFLNAEVNSELDPVRVAPFFRPYVYSWGAPNIHFKSLYNNMLIGRLDKNRTIIHDVRQADGHYLFHPAANADVVSRVDSLKSFVPSPLITSYFDELLKTLEANDIELRFIAMPVNPETLGNILPGTRLQIAAFIADRTRRYNAAHQVGPLFYARSSSSFNDPLFHLNQKGADDLSGTLRDCGLLNRQGSNTEITTRCLEAELR